MDAAWLLGHDSGPSRSRTAMGQRRWTRFELRCFRCGYGTVVRIAPGRCPLCGGSAWEHPARLQMPLLGGG